MALDLQTVHLQNVVPISRVRVTSVSGVVSIALTGDDFHAVDDVLINGVSSPDFVITSRTTLIAQLPDSLQSNPDINDVMVLNRTFTAAPSSLLRFRIGDTPSCVRGGLRLLQLFVKLLLSTPGSDIFNRALGGGALKSVGATFSHGDSQSIKADFILAVDRVARQMVSIQSRNGSLSRDERLLSAKLTGATFSRATGSLFVTIEVVSQQGTSSRVNLEL